MFEFAHRPVSANAFNFVKSAFKPCCCKADESSAISHSLFSKPRLATLWVFFVMVFLCVCSRSVTDGEFSKRASFLCCDPLLILSTYKLGEVFLELVVSADLVCHIDVAYLTRVRLNRSSSNWLACKKRPRSIKYS